MSIRPPNPAVPRLDEDPGARPSLGRALSGVWQLTWRSRWSWRQLSQLLGTVLALPLLAWLGLRSHPDAATPLFHWSVVFYLQLVLPIYCLTVFGDLVRGELEAGTLVFLTTRPVTRAQLLVLKVLCHLGWVQVLALVSAGLLLAAGWAGKVEGIQALAPLVLAAQLLAVLAYGALSVALGLVHRRFLVLGVVYGVVVDYGLAQIPTNLNNISFRHHLSTLLGNAAYFHEMYDWSPEGAGWAVLWLLLATGLYLAIAAVLFTFREYHASEEMRK